MAPGCWVGEHWPRAGAVVGLSSVMESSQSAVGRPVALVSWKQHPGPGWLLGRTAQHHHSAPLAPQEWATALQAIGF